MIQEKERKPGYYRVKLEGTWMILPWRSPDIHEKEKRVWSYEGTIMNDEDMDEIDESPVTATPSKESEPQPYSIADLRDDALEACWRHNNDTKIPDENSFVTGYIDGHFAGYGMRDKEVLKESEPKTDELKRLQELINNPEIEDFVKGVTLEAVHQIERWGLENEERKSPHHFIMVANKLIGKMCVDIWDKDTDKFKHHCIALAAEFANVHRQVQKEGTAINKWFKDSEDKQGSMPTSQDVLQAAAVQSQSRVKELENSLRAIIDATEDKDGKFSAWHKELRKVTKEGKEILTK